MKFSYIMLVLLGLGFLVACPGGSGFTDPKKVDNVTVTSRFFADCAPRSDCRCACFALNVAGLFSSFCPLRSWQIEPSLLQFLL
jgi:hypothetical protein